VAAGFSCKLVLFNSLAPRVGLYLHQGGTGNRLALPIGRCVIDCRSAAGFFNVYALARALLSTGVMAGAMCEPPDCGRHFGAELTAACYFAWRSPCSLQLVVLFIHGGKFPIAIAFDSITFMNFAPTQTDRRR